MYMVGWEDDVHTFETEVEAKKYVEADLIIDQCETWEQVLEVVNEVNAEGNYHQYIAMKIG